MKLNILVGTSQMAIDYEKVLQSQQWEHNVVGRSKVGCDLFYEKTLVKPIQGGLENYLKTIPRGTIQEAIVAVGVEQLYNCATQLIEHGCKFILIEKPGSLTEEEFLDLQANAERKKVKIFIGYNRRFYASVLYGLEIINDDGGVTSFNFEFTEWSHKIELLNKNPGVKENWFLGNSTHVVDMAFFMGGYPSEISSYSSGQLSWHERSIFGGAGISDMGAIFSYKANWESAGRWGVEILTAKRKLIFCPLEGLKQQMRGTIIEEEIQLVNNLDIEFKPGLYKQAKAFVSKDFRYLKTLSQQVKDYYIYNKILKGSH